MSCPPPGQPLGEEVGEEVGAGVSVEPGSRQVLLPQQQEEGEDGGGEGLPVLGLALRVVVGHAGLEEAQTDLAGSIARHGDRTVAGPADQSWRGHTAGSLQVDGAVHREGGGAPGGGAGVLQPAGQDVLDLRQLLPPPGQEGVVRRVPGVVEDPRPGDPGHGQGQGVDQEGGDGGHHQGRALGHDVVLVQDRQEDHPGLLELSLAGPAQHVDPPDELGEDLGLLQQLLGEVAACLAASDVGLPAQTEGEGRSPGQGGELGQPGQADDGLDGGLELGRRAGPGLLQQDEQSGEAGGGHQGRGGPGLRYGCEECGVGEGRELEVGQPHHHVVGQADHGGDGPAGVGGQR